MCGNDSRIKTEREEKRDKRKDSETDAATAPVIDTDGETPDKSKTLTSKTVEPWQSADSGSVPCYLPVCDWLKIRYQDR